MTSTNSQSARETAIRDVRAQLGLSDVPSDWSYAQRNAYNKALAAYIAANPDKFTSQEILTAEIIAKNAYSALEDDSFDLGLFVSETVKPASDALQGVGNGVLTVANSAKWALPLAALGVGALLLLALNKKLGSPLKA